MRVSHRIANLTDGGSDGWEVFNHARKLVANGAEITELTIGEHDVGTDPVILEAMHAAAMGGHTGYASVPGIRTLRQTLAERYTARTGVPTDIDNVVITPGGQSALFAAHAGCCDTGDTGLHIDPYYATYPATIRGVGAKPRAVITRSRDGFQPQKDVLNAAAEGARSILINTPNNPTGVVYAPETIRNICDVARDHDLWIISDEVYDTQVWAGEHLSPRMISGMADQTLVIGSMSKSHAMTGSRVGWIIGPKEMISHLIDLSTCTTYGVPGYIQVAAEFALKQGRELEEKIAAPFRRRREIAKRLLDRQKVIKLIPADGAMYLMLDIRATGQSGEAFAWHLLEQERIAVMPGESFGKAAAGHIRVAMTVEDDAFETALQKLCATAEELAA